jgi:hypothetical protein
VTQTDGFIEDTFGIICRAKDDQYYALEIGNDGWYGIGRVNGDEYTSLTEPDGDRTTTDASYAITKAQAEEESYRLRADCIGDTLSLYVDGEKVAEVQDDALRSGGVGLTAYNYDAPRTEILFDNIVVSKP